jgi:hypothetical protein
VILNRNNLPEFRNKDFAGGNFRQTGPFFDLEDDDFKPTTHNPLPKS